jgi:hypothetical protein
MSTERDETATPAAPAPAQEHTCHDMNPPFPGPCHACEIEKAEAAPAAEPRRDSHRVSSNCGAECQPCEDAKSLARELAQARAECEQAERLRGEEAARWQEAAEQCGEVTEQLEAARAECEQLRQERDALRRTHHQIDPNCPCEHCIATWAVIVQAGEERDAARAALAERERVAFMAGFEKAAKTWGRGLDPRGRRLAGEHAYAAWQATQPQPAP